MFVLAILSVSIFFIWGMAFWIIRKHFSKLTLSSSELGVRLVKPEEANVKPLRLIDNAIIKMKNFAILIYNSEGLLFEITNSVKETNFA